MILLLALLGGTPSVPSSAHRSTRDPVIVRGRVVDSSKYPIAGATITITGSSSGTARTVTTGRDGRYAAAFADGETGYELLVRHIGYTPQVRNISALSVATSIEADFTLAPTPYPLPQIVVNARPPGFSTLNYATDRPSIGGTTTGFNFTERYLTDAADLDQLLQLAPGVFHGPDGVSVLGASPAQNSMLLDGMTFDATVLPPDARCAAHLAIATSDPARGQFAGAQTSLTSCRGGSIIQSAIRASLLQPWLAWNDPTSTQRPAGALNASGFVAGPLPGGAHWRLSGTLLSSSADLVSVTSVTGAALQAIGLSIDSLNAVRNAIAGFHFPMTTLPSASQRGNAAIAATLDAREWFLTANASTLWADAQGFSALSFPSTALRNQLRNGRLMLSRSAPLGGVAVTTTAVVSAADTRLMPYLAGPRANVFVGTSTSTGANGIVALQLAGGGIATTARKYGVNLKNDFIWTSGRHRLDLGQQLMLDGSNAEAPENAGAFAYQSIADLAGNTPSGFFRTIGGTASTARRLDGSAWLGDAWALHSRISLQGGLRVDGQHFGASAPLNPTVDSAFQLRTDQTPNYATLSPRIGFAWLVHRVTRMIGLPGQEHPILQSDAALTAGALRTNTTSAGVTLSGNVGWFAGTVAPDRVGVLAQRTGLLGAVQALNCVGSATPIPDWSSVADAPITTCADGATAQTFASLTPSVAVMSPSFRAPVSIRASTTLTGLERGQWRIVPGVQLALNRHIESRLDANLVASPSFALADEGGRPVYAPASAIVPQSGAVSASAARLDPRFGSVFDAVSDLTGRAAQFTIALAHSEGANGKGSLPFRIDYFFSAQQYQQRGFGASASTSGNPAVVETVTGAAPTHMLDIYPGPTGGFRIGPVVASVHGVITSGVAFTPMVVGDINGDGLSNDRAFVPVTSSIADSLEASQWKALLQATPPFARECLDRQVGKIAASMSCRGPWQFRVDFNLDFKPQPARGVANRFSLSVHLLNAGATVLRLAGISSAAGNGGTIDNRLLYVAGFDPVQQRFIYRVNSSFGASFANALSNHGYPPFQLQVGGEYMLARAEPNPLLRSQSLAPPKRGTYDVTQVAEAVGKAYRDPITSLLDARDSLALTSLQVDEIVSIDSAWRRSADSVAATFKARFMDIGAARMSDRLFRPLWDGFRLAEQRVALDAFGRAFSLLSSAQVVVYEALLVRR